MLEKFNRRSIRLQDYDYSQEGLYFITICCQDRAHRFGKVINGEMVLNEYGKIAEQEWLNTEKIRPNVQLDEYVVMPNHVHGIIIITRRGELHSPPLTPTPRTGKSHLPTLQTDTNAPERPDANALSQRGELQINEPTLNINANRATLSQRGELHSPLQGTSNTVGAIIRGYKSAVTKWMRQNTDIHDVWQRNYYEHIIRNDKSYQNISQYIKNNPLNWQNDKFY